MPHHFKHYNTVQCKIVSRSKDILSTLFLACHISNSLHSLHCNPFILCAAIKPWIFLLQQGWKLSSSFIRTFIVLWLTFCFAAVIFAERCGFLRNFSWIFLMCTFVQIECGRPDLGRFLQLLMCNYLFIVLYINVLLKSRHFNYLKILPAENPRSKSFLIIQKLSTLIENFQMRKFSAKDAKRTKLFY